MDYYSPFFRNTFNFERSRCSGESIYDSDRFSNILSGMTTADEYQRKFEEQYRANKYMEGIIAKLDAENDHLVELMEEKHHQQEIEFQQLEETIKQLVQMNLDGQDPTQLVEQLRQKYAFLQDKKPKKPTPYQEFCIKFRDQKKADGEEFDHQEMNQKWVEIKERQKLIASLQEKIDF